MQLFGARVHIESLGDAGGSGATLPPDVTVDPTAAGHAGYIESEMNRLGLSPSWLPLVYIGLGIFGLIALGYVVRSFKE